MSKMTGHENWEQLPEKVRLLYGAVVSMIEEGEDVVGASVSEITKKAGIGKGTAYDYFDSKEEIIVYALLSYVENLIADMQQGVLEQKCFADRVKLLLERIENQLSSRACIFRYASMFFENTPIGSLFRKNVMGKEKHCPAMLFVKKIIQKGIEDGELRTDLPEDYMLYTLVARFVTYVSYLLWPKQEKDPDDHFRDYIYQGIMGEMCLQDP